mgnify:CR=1 FL=1
MHNLTGNGIRKVSHEETRVRPNGVAPTLKKALLLHAIQFNNLFFTTVYD